MITEATAIHTAYPEYLAREVRDQIFRQGTNPFQSDYFVNVKDPSIRGEILQGGPCIVLATSGMLEGDLLSNTSNKWQQTQGICSFS